MNQSEVLKRIEQAKAKHDKRREKALKDPAYPYDMGEFKGLSLKYYKRLVTFKANNVEFDPISMTATSYRWWVFVKKVNGKLLFNDASYSNTTSRHQSCVRSVLNDLGLKYTSIQMPDRQDLSNLSKETTLSKYRSLIETEIEIANTTKGRLKTGAHSARLWTAKDLKKQIKVLESLGFKVAMKDVNQLRKTMLANEVERVKRAKQEKADQKAFLKRQFETNEAFNLNLGA